MGDELLKRHIDAVLTADSYALSYASLPFLESPWAVVIVTSVIAFLIVITLRPPFALRRNQDADRPWRSSQEISWTSVFILTLVCGLGTFLLCRHSESWYLKNG